MWFDEVVPLLPYLRDVNGTKQSDCPRCGGWIILEPYAEDIRQGNVKCIGTRGLNKCGYKELDAHLNDLVRDAKASGYYKTYYDKPGEYVPGEEEQNNGHPEPEPPTVEPERQTPIATSERKRKVETFTDADLMAMQFEEPRWAVPGILCEGLNVLAGAQKLGKSWLVGGAGIAVSSGGMVLGKIPVLQGDVLYLAMEDTKRRLKDRLSKMLKGAEPSGRLEIATEWPRMHEGGLDWIRKWLETHKEARLVIIDTLKKIRPPRGQSGSFYDEDYEIGSALKEVADEFGICMVVVTHVSKAPHEDIFNAVSGSMGVTASADATLILERPRGSTAGVLHLTGRDVEEKSGEDAMAIEFDGLSGCWTLKGTVGEVGMSDERREILEVLDRTLNPMSPKEIADKLGKKDGNIRFLIKKMHDAGEVRSVSGKYLPPCVSANGANAPNGDESESQWWNP
jgi:hypothetical protein